MAIEVSGVTDIDSLELIVDRCLEILKVSHTVKVDLAACAANQHSVGTDVGVIHRADKVEHPLAAAEVEVGDDLLLLVNSLLNGRAAIAVGATDYHLRELLGRDRCGFEPDTKQLSNQADAVVAMANRDLRLENVPQLPGGNHG